MQRVRDELRLEVAREYEKTIYILQFLTISDQNETQARMKENDFGLGEEEFAVLIAI